MFGQIIIERATLKSARTASLIGVFLAGAIWMTNARAADDQWEYSLTPYLWLPSFKATIKYQIPPGNDASPEVETSYLNTLNGAFMLSGDARRGDFSIYSDLLYIDISGGESHIKSLDFGNTIIDTIINAGTQTSIIGLAWTLAGGYTLLQKPGVSLDVIGGLRYLSIDITTDWRLSATVTAPPGSVDFPISGTISQGVDLWDAIIGMRGNFHLGDSGKWSVPYYFDVGVGSSVFTLQALMGVAYSYHWGDLMLTYRYLSYGQSSDNFIQNLSLSGPLLAATFRF